jgi:CheY-like chemotaxis protein
MLGVKTHNGEFSLAHGATAVTALFESAGKHLNCPEGDLSMNLVRFIRSLEHRKTTAVIMVTGCGEVKEEALAAGADEVLVKPINPHAMVWAVDKHVS